MFLCLDESVSVEKRNKELEPSTRKKLSSSNSWRPQESLGCNASVRVQWFC